ncbi:MAG: HpcH/HpaI aldolase, partial [Paenibacillus sp.]|nr:HpcH/HpaI aldolase [Paenibacillus sp.]
MEGLLRMCNMVGLTAVVRVPDIGYSHISKVLDLGADGVLIPRIETLAQLEKVIEYTRLPPVGKKGVGGHDFSRKPLMETLANYNTSKMIFAQIESPQGIAELDSMLATKEVAGVIVGPSDLSVSMGIPMQTQDPRFIEAVQEVIRICNKHQVSSGMFMGGKENTEFWLGQGMNIVWSGSDFGFFQAGYSQWVTMIDGIK